MRNFNFLRLIKRSLLGLLWLGLVCPGALEPGKQVVELFACFAIFGLAGIEAQAQLSAVVLQLLALTLENLRQETKLYSIVALEVDDETYDVQYQSFDLLLAQLAAHNSVRLKSRVL